MFLSCFWKCKHLKSLVCIFCSFCWSWLVCSCAWLLLAVVWTFDLKLTFRIILKLTASAVFFKEHLTLGYLDGMPVCFLINKSRSHISGFVLHYVIVVVNFHHVKSASPRKNFRSKQSFVLTGFHILLLLEYEHKTQSNDCFTEFFLYCYSFLWLKTCCPPLFLGALWERKTFVLLGISLELMVFITSPPLCVLQCAPLSHSHSQPESVPAIVSNNFLGCSSCLYSHCLCYVFIRSHLG